MNLIKGIDVSHNNGHIDWQRVAASGVKFTFVKATEGVSFVDPRFVENVVNAHAAGIAVCTYHFTTAADTAQAQIDHYMATIQPHESKLGSEDLGLSPVCLDFERRSGIDWMDLATGLRIQRVNHLIEELDAAIGKPTIYCSPSWWDEAMQGADHSGHPLWVANYGVESPRVPAPWTDWTIWQYAEHGRCDGVSGDVDLDWIRAAP